MNQVDIENKYSRKAIRSKVKADVNIDSAVFTKCITAVENYQLKDYYLSKNKRLVTLAKMPTADIVLELFASVLPYQDMTPIQAIAANLGSRLGYEYILDGIKTAAEIIAVCEITGLYVIYHESHDSNNTSTLAILAQYHLSQDVLENIDRAMFLPPMLCKPRNWQSNKGGGYINGNSSCLLGNTNHHDMKLNLASLNLIQRIPWELNTYILEFEEQPNKPLDTDDKVKQFNKFKDDSVEVRKLLLDNGNRFYFAWSYDTQGRCYSRGYHVNLQSTDYQKASIQFKHKEQITS